MNSLVFTCPLIIKAEPDTNIQIANIHDKNTLFERDSNGVVHGDLYDIFSYDNRNTPRQAKFLGYMSELPKLEQAKLPWFAQASRAYLFLWERAVIAVLKDQTDQAARAELTIHLVIARQNAILPVIQEGYSKFINKWNEKRYFIGLDLRTSNLDQLDFSNLDLSESDFSRSSMKGTNLYNSYLTKAVLLQTDLSFAKLAMVEFNEATMIETILDDADLTDAMLSDAVMTNASLVRTNLTRARLAGADVYGANFDQATINGTAFEEIRNLEFANLSEAQRALINGNSGPPLIIRIQFNS